MAEEDRHEAILQCISEILQDGTNDAYLSQEIRIEDYNENQAPSVGISISPLGERELIGTNSQDDIQYITLVTRVVHSLGEDDRREKSLFRVNMRQLFHNKRIQCDDGCNMYSRIDFGPFSIPREWAKSNNSTSSMKVLTTVRDYRG